MKNWLTLEPDRYKLMNKHYTPGRGGNNIECVVVHHNAGVLSIDQIWDVWQTRQASAHYQVQSDGQIGQLVNDWDTAWHAANQYTNQRSIGIEVSNSAGPNADWPITDTAIREAGRLIAAVCLNKNLGRPVSGGNVRYHREFTGTSCPYHLAPGGKYNKTLIDEAQRFYDELAAGRVNPDGSARPAPKHAQPAPRNEPVTVLTTKYFRDFLTGFIGPVISDVKDIRQQLTGGRNAGQYDGWSVSQLVRNYQSKPGDNGTIPEMLAVIITELGKLREDIDHIKENR